jgi:hypothetical protein
MAEKRTRDRTRGDLTDDVLYYLYRSDGGRTYGSLCSLLFDRPDNYGRQRTLWMSDTRRAVRALEERGLVNRSGVEYDGVWWIDLTYPEGHLAAKEVFETRHPDGLRANR